MPQPMRRDFRQHLSALEDLLLATGNVVLAMVGDAMRALVNHDEVAAESVLRSHQRVKAACHQAQEDILTALALQAPVARDLRLLTALLHTNLHVERMSGLCVAVARAAELVEDLPAAPALLAELDEMGRHVRKVLTRSLEAFARRDLSAVATLPRLDDPVDRLNEGLFRRLVELSAADETRLDWAMRMVLVARYLERLADHAVELGEQTVFAVTGQAV